MISGRARVITPEGVQPASTLGSTATIWSGDQWVLAKVTHEGPAEVVTVCLNNGLTIDCTPDQAFLVRDKDLYRAARTDELRDAYVCLGQGTPDVMSRTPERHASYWLGRIFAEGEFFRVDWGTNIRKGSSNRTDDRILLPKLRYVEHKQALHAFAKSLSVKWTVTRIDDQIAVHGASVLRELANNGMWFGPGEAHKPGHPIMDIGPGNWMRPGRARRMFARGIIDATRSKTKLELATATHHGTYCLRLGTLKRMQQVLEFLQTVGVKGRVAGTKGKTTGRYRSKAQYYAAVPNWVVGMELLRSLRNAPAMSHFSEPPGVPEAVIDALHDTMLPKPRIGPSPLVAELLKEGRPVLPAAVRAVERSLKMKLPTPIFDFDQITLVTDGESEDVVRIHTDHPEQRFCAGGMVLTNRI